MQGVHWWDCCPSGQQGTAVHLPCPFTLPSSPPLPVADPKQGNFNYSYALEGWLEAFPQDQVHIIQFEDIEENPEQELADLKTFLGMDPALPQEEWRNVNNRAAAVDGDPMRLEEYEKMVGWVKKDARKVAEVLNAHSAVDGDAFLAKWEEKWRHVREERCNSNGDCLINSH